MGRRQGEHDRLNRGDAGIGRAAIFGAIAGYFTVVALLTVIVLVAGAGLGTALAVGAFVGIWGGPGFGGMAAAQRYADRLAEEERRSARESPPDREAAAA